ncbi:MAG TPA: hypothetical protein VD971_00160 [Phycisphaerales bacterium]|nr:hypothetical protein [Phycisphaerales bacterium]
MSRSKRVNDGIIAFLAALALAAGCYFIADWALSGYYAAVEDIENTSARVRRRGGPVGLLAVIGYGAALAGVAFVIGAFWMLVHSIAAKPVAGDE